MTISNAAQFGLLLWKNWLLQKRRIVVTVFQILMPTLIALLLLAIRALVKSEFVYSPTWNWISFDALTSPNLSLPMPILGNLDPARARNMMLGSGNATSLPWMLVYALSLIHI